MPFELNKKQFLGNDVFSDNTENPRFYIIPVPYEGAVSYGHGTSLGPDALIEASQYLELYDEVLETEPWRSGIRTTKPVFPDPEGNIVEPLRIMVKNILRKKQIPVVIGGDHSISSGFCKALNEEFGDISVIQIDAHADLRDSYENNKYSHASVMSRIREITEKTLQIGIRSLSFEEAVLIKGKDLNVCFMHQIRKDFSCVEKALDLIPDPVFITFDVDALDWSVIKSTGTPEPGGLLWDEIIRILDLIFSKKKVVGFDIVELSGNKNDPNSAFAAAKLIYKMIGFSLKY